MRWLGLLGTGDAAHFLFLPGWRVCAGVETVASGREASGEGARYSGSVMVRILSSRRWLSMVGGGGVGSYSGVAVRTGFSWRVLLAAGC